VEGSGKIVCREVLLADRAEGKGQAKEEEGIKSHNQCLSNKIKLSGVFGAPFIKLDPGIIEEIPALVPVS